jgi:geranylgeranyl diphosphate synthase, type II
MDPNSRIEQALRDLLGEATALPAPPGLSAALGHAVFPGGARVRPRLCLSVAFACGDDRPRLADAAAAAIELLHCASLVHDDLPCFDDAAVRRGRPSVHRAYGERLAVLAGDTLIVLAFQALAARVSDAPARAAALLQTLAQAGGSPWGIGAGQAWECESAVSVAAYHRAKTGSLFAAATVSGALAAGADPVAWRAVGEYLGEAYQVADDLRDALGRAEDLGKPVGQDRAHGRPSAVTDLGVHGAKRRLDGLVSRALASIPDCRGAEQLRAGIVEEMHRVLPCKLSLVAA